MHNILTSKRIVSMAIALCLLAAFIVGCAGDDDDLTLGEDGAYAYVPEGADVPLAAADEDRDTDRSPRRRPDEDSTPALVGDANVDIDFTALSDVMMISMFVNMMNEPEQFLGQTIRMAGVQQTFHFEEYTFHYIMLMADECCGDIILEFRLTEDTLMDDGVMSGSANVEVIGTFGQYPFRDHMFVYISADSVRFTS